MSVPFFAYLVHKSLNTYQSETYLKKRCIQKWSTRFMFNKPCLYVFRFSSLNPFTTNIQQSRVLFPTHPKINEVFYFQ
jgi:hypothetical protein